MKVKPIISSCFFFLFFPLLLLSQQKKELSSFQKELKGATDKFSSIVDFKKAQSFFLEQQWDSTLIYSMRQLSANIESKELENYCHFFRGFSFREKSILNEAKEEFSKISKDFEFYNHTKIALGGIAFEQSDFKKAIHYYKVIDSIKKADFKGLKKTNIEENIGSCYLHLKEYDIAKAYFQKSISSHEVNKDTLELIGSYGNIASLYYNQYLDDEAIPYYQKAYELSKKIDNYEKKLETANNMAVVEKNRKNFSLALTYTDEVIKYKDFLNDRDRTWEIGEIEKEHAVQQKQDEVDNLAIENKLKEAERDRYLYIAIMLVLMLIALVYFYKEKVKNNKIIVAQKEKLDQLNATKDKMFSIVSHDLRSSVHALKTSNTELSENLEAKNLEALDGLLNTNSAIVNGAYNLLDNLLHWALLQTKQSYFEISEIRLFFIVEQTAYNYKPLMQDKQLQFENKVSKSDLIDADQESLKIVLRNLLDNAIKFSNPEGKITIYTKNTNDQYCNLIIEDTGLGMSEATRLELIKDTGLLAKKENENVIGTGLGLQLCKSIIQKNNGKFTIESELGKGTKMIVSLRKNLLNGSS
jgi:signal transduction histidine kinase